jgi:plasmid stability protein
VGAGAQDGGGHEGILHYFAILLLHTNMFLCKNADMRTTLDLPDSLFKHLKARAALEGRSLRDLVIELVERGLNTRETVNPQQRFLARPLVGDSLPLALPATKLSNAYLYDLTHEDDDERARKLMAGG